MQPGGSCTYAHTLMTHACRPFHFQKPCSGAVRCAGMPHPDHCRESEQHAQQAKLDSVCLLCNMAPIPPGRQRHERCMPGKQSDSGGASGRRRVRAKAWLACLTLLR